MTTPKANTYIKTHINYLQILLKILNQELDIIDTVLQGIKSRIGYH